MSHDEVRAILVQKFPARHIDACLRHFVEASEKFLSEDWDGVALKSGKFVEAVTKALMIHCGKTLPAKARRFQAGAELRNLEGVDASVYSDTVRIVIPKACILVYEIVNNRGGRHDATDIDANAMDATVVLPVLSWTLAEMVRYCATGGDIAEATSLIEALTKKVLPYFEDIDGRTYVNLRKAKASDLALLLLYAAYPKRVTPQNLVDSVKRHGPKAGAASTAVYRLKKIVDDDNGRWKLRALGRERSEQLLKKLSSERPSTRR